MTRSKRGFPCAGLLIAILCILAAVGMTYCQRHHESAPPSAPADSSENI